MTFVLHVPVHVLKGRSATCG